MDDPAGDITRALPGLLEVVQGSDICELELSEGTVRIRLHRLLTESQPEVDASVVEPDDFIEAESMSTEVRSPLVGTFYRAGRPGMEPLVTEGSRVEDDSVVGIIEALQHLTDVEAGCNGIVSKVFATDGQSVEYGQPLFEVVVDG